jgi:hypothetical protein
VVLIADHPSLITTHSPLYVTTRPRKLFVPQIPAIKGIYLMGLALDYCVKYSALDARQLRLKTHVIVDGCRGIELEPDDIGRALDEMKRARAVLLKSSDL